MLLDRKSSQLMIIDVQEKLYPAILDGEDMLQKINLINAAARQMDIPVTVTEQYPKGLGHTLASVTEPMNNFTRLEKMAFSCTEDAAIAKHISYIREEQNRPQIVLTGMEAHVCVLQTAFGLKAGGYDVFVAMDAVSSRHAETKRLAEQRFISNGIHVVSAEMVFFEWIHTSGTDDFRALSKLLK